MSEWWEHGYPGGPMVPVPGFPRAVYPPDAKGYPVSEDGPDVIAYKRTVSRAGRWPWQSFDDTYSNGFAHGTSGNVGQSGLAGVQRQGGVTPDTGYIGNETFNLLRSIIIPVGLPHAGEYAMDANAQTLIAEAYRKFHPPPKPAQTVREAALSEAEHYLGYVEGANNNTTFGAWYGMNYSPWCAMFLTYCFETGAAGGSPSFAKGSRYAYVPYIVSDAQNTHNGLSVTSKPIPGDLVCYDWNGGDYDHVGIVESGNAQTWTAIEGNTSSSSAGSQSNGGGVYRRTRNVWDAARITFVRVAEPA